MLWFMKNKLNNMASVGRCFFIIVFLFLFSGPRLAFCQDFLMGKVLAVHPNKMEIEIAPLPAEKLSETGADNITILVRIAEENNLPGNGRTVFFPRSVVVGERIRLWGSMVQNGDPVFVATDIRGCRGRGCFDPTGVRYRLLQIRKHKQRHRHIDDTNRQDSDIHKPNRDDHPEKGYGWTGENSGGGGGGN
jgi:hypothetical protein